MRPLSSEARQVAERFASIALDKLDGLKPEDREVKALREACFDWIEHHADKKLNTRRMLETT